MSLQTRTEITLTAICHKTTSFSRMRLEVAAAYEQMSLTTALLYHGTTEGGWPGTLIIVIHLRRFKSEHCSDVVVLHAILRTARL